MNFYSLFILFLKEMDAKRGKNMFKIASFFRKKKYIDMACVTHTGKIRTDNEDNFVFNGKYMPEKHQSSENILECQKPMEEYTKIALFDGMGGEYGGEMASYEAAKAFCEVSDKFFWNEKELIDITRVLNDAVCKRSTIERVSQMGTTMILAGFQESKCWIANLGDSPAYQWRKGSLELLTCPHTNEEMLREQGIIHRKPGLTQFLGIFEKEFLVEPYIQKIDLMSGDQILLCSDGLTDMVSEKDLSTILNQKDSIKIKVKKLLESALNQGGKDNITIILCQIS